MAATFLNPTPLPGDGARLLQQNYNKRTRGRKKIKSFLNQSPDEQDEVEAGMRGPKHVETFLGPSHDNGQVPTSYLVAPDRNLDNVPRTIRSEEPLSHEADLPTLSQPQLTSFLSPNLEPAYTLSNGPSIDCSLDQLKNTTMVQPPHLRSKVASSSSSGNGKGKQIAEAPTLTNGEINTTPEAAPHLKDGNDQERHFASSQRPDGLTIRQKLQDEFAVTVSDAQPAKSAKSARPALVPYPSSNESDEHAPKDINHSVPSKTANGKSKGPLAKSSDGSRANGHNSDQQSRRGGGQGGRGRGRGRGFQGRQTRESRWPTTAETKADPHRWDQDRDWDSSSYDIDSLCADQGFGDADGKMKRKHRDDGIDSETGFQLADWSGNWAPPPENWDIRPAFSNRRQTSDHIERWMDSIDEAMCGKKWAIPADEFSAASADALASESSSPNVAVNEFAPRYWMPVVFGNQAPQTFWNELVRSTVPKPIDAGDLDGVKPWWELYQVQGGNVLKPYQQPEIKGIDPDEKSDERIARENDYGSSQHAENRKRTERAKRDHQRDRRKRAEEKARKISESSRIARSTQVIKPGVSLYIRSAKPADIPRIREIYNYYVDNSACTPETERRTVSDIQLRYNDILANQLPFLVACERGGKLKGRRRKNEEDVVLPDKVVGFATADDYNDMRGMYRFTAEMEVFIDKDYYMKGVAKCLLDKLTALLDPDYIERGGYGIEGEELEGIGVGASRVIKNVVVHIPYDNPNRLEWIGRWLTNWLGFKQVGDLEHVGNKNGKSVNLAIFQRTTGANVDAAQPPIMMQYPK